MSCAPYTATRGDAAAAGNWIFLWAYLRRQPTAMLALAAVLVVGTALSLAGPLVLRHYIDSVTRDSLGSQAVALAVAFIVVGVAGRAFQAVEAAVAESIAWRSTNQLRLETLEHCLRLPMSFHHDHTPGELVERVDGDINLLSNLFSRFVVTVISQLLLMVGVLAALTVVEWRIGLLLTALIAIGVWILRAEAAWGRTAYVRLRETVGGLMGFLEERLSGVEDIQANGAVDHTLTGFGRTNRQLLRHDLRAALVGSSLIWASASTFISIATALALGAAAWLTGAGALTIGTVYLVFAYTQQLQEPLIALSHQMQDYQRAMAGLTRVRQILSMGPEPQGGDAPLPAGAASVTFEDVTFSYRPGATILDNVSFSVPAGTSLGIVGHTGAGKTTIARLLVAMHHHQAGAIRIGGAEVGGVDLMSLRDRVALVTQDVHLLAGTVRDNVAMLDNRVDDATIRRAIDELGLRPWLANLPDGLDTLVGDHRHGLSAGQAQLLALTRVFVRDPDVVVLDEASSRLDPLTESLLETAIGPLLEERTSIVIAHRLSTLERVDRILVLDRGKVVEQGPRAHLAADRSSHFSSLLEAARG